jgi:hypothetical protein
MILAMRVQCLGWMRLVGHITKMTFARVRDVLVGGVFGVDVAQVGVLGSEIRRRGALVVDGCDGGVGCG